LDTIVCVVQARYTTGWRLQDIHEAVIQLEGLTEPQLLLIE